VERTERLNQPSSGASAGFGGARYMVSGSRCSVLGDYCPHREPSTGNRTPIDRGLDLGH